MRVDVLTLFPEWFDWLRRPRHLANASAASGLDIRCFNHEPSIKSSLKFLRRTPWARSKVEGLYLEFLQNSTNEEQA